MREKSEMNQPTFAFTADVSEAHRQVPIHRSDWRYLRCRVQEHGSVYINTVGTVGISSHAVRPSFSEAQHDPCGAQKCNVNNRSAKESLERCNHRANDHTLPHINKVLDVSENQNCGRNSVAMSLAAARRRVPANGRGAHRSSRAR